VSKPLQVLIVEDSENDALLLELELQRAGYGTVCHRVDTAAAMSAALARQRWDVVIADYVMLGGGNAKLLNQLPNGIELGHNRNAYLGGCRMWEKNPRTRQPKWNVI